MAIMPGEVVRVRAPRRAQVPSYLFAITFVPVTLNVWTRSPVSPWLAGFWVVSLLVVVAPVAHGLLRPPGVDLRDDAAVVVGPLRSRVVPRRDVQAVALRRGRDVTLYLADRTVARCPYPSRNLLFVPWRRVDDDFHRVGQWWLAHRGADRRPLHVPAPYPAPMLFPPATPRSVDDVWRTPPEAWR